MQLRSALLLLVLWLSVAQRTSASEVSVDFVRQPASLRYNPFYDKFELSLDLNITGVAERRVTGLKVIPESGILRKNFGAFLMGRVSSDGTAGQLVFLCNTWRRCLNIRRGISADPSYIRKAVRFAPYGLQDGSQKEFSSVRSLTSPVPSPEVGSEVVFQRHLDNSLSFAQNWDTYVRGFGDPSGNYWMGLEQLSAMTKDRNCKFTFEGARFDGSLMRHTFTGFQVLGEDTNYTLMLGGEDPGGDLYNDTRRFHNLQQFSTYDRDNDGLHGSCSVTQTKKTGWWFESCHFFNPNGVIAEIQVDEIFCLGYCVATDVFGAYICLTKTQLTFSCT